MAMDSSNVILQDVLHDWIENETQPLDVVASWETMCETYRILEFSDPLSDTVKLEEFKWIIKEMNKFLSRMRTKLLTCKDEIAVQDMLTESFVPIGKVNIDGRRALAFQKLRQRWISQMIATIDQWILRNMEESEDGWTDRYAD